MLAVLSLSERCCVSCERNRKCETVILLQNSRFRHGVLLGNNREDKSWRAESQLKGQVSFQVQRDDVSWV